MSRISDADFAGNPSRRAFVLGASTVAALQVGPAARAALAAPDAATLQRAAEIANAVRVARPLAPPGLSMAVASSQGVLWAEGRGKADIEFDLAVSPAHRFRLGSVSKVLTSTAAARLVSRRILDLDVPISTWIPDLPAQHRQTTLRQLFTHRGGVRHYLPRDLDPRSPGGAIYQRIYPTSKEILAVFIDDPLVAPPGTQVLYSSFGFTLASLVMEAAAKQPFTQIIASEIGTTFDLPSLATDDPLAIVPLRAKGYSSALDMGLASRESASFWYAGRTGQWLNMPMSNPAYCWAGAGFLLTPSDMARFGAALLDSPASRITPAERALLFTPMTEKTASVPPLGLAWQIDTDGKGRRRFHHAGATLGGRANLLIYPDQGLSIAIAGNALAAPGNVLQPSSDLADVFA